MNGRRTGPFDRAEIKRRPKRRPLYRIFIRPAGEPGLYTSRCMAGKVSSAAQPNQIHIEVVASGLLLPTKRS
jgi:hypothetical protein